MFSFIKKYAESLNGAGIYGDIGLIIFVTVFLFALAFALKADKKYISEQAELPLNDSLKN